MIPMGAIVAMQVAQTAVRNAALMNQHCRRDQEKAKRKKKESEKK